MPKPPKPMLPNQMKYNYGLHNTKLIRLTYDKLVVFIQPHPLRLGDFLYKKQWQNCYFLLLSIELETWAERRIYASVN